MSGRIQESREQDNAVDKGMGPVAGSSLGIFLKHSRDRTKFVGPSCVVCHRNPEERRVGSVTPGHVPGIFPSVFLASRSS